MREKLFAVLENEKLREFVNENKDIIIKVAAAV